MTVIPPRDPLDQDPQGTSMRIGKNLLAAIDAIAEDEGYSRNEVLVYLLKWGLRAYEGEKETEKKKK